MLSDFFDYRTEGYAGEDMFGISHLIFMFVGTIIIILLSILLRKTAHRKITVFLKVLAILMPLLEIVKIVWESYHYISLTGSFEWGGILPLYLCSMFMIALPLAAFGKGRIRTAGLSFLCTLGIVGGYANFMFLNVLKEVPFWRYATFVSIIYHSLMVFTGVWLLSSRYYQAQIKDVLYGFLTVVTFSLLAIPIAYYLEYNGFPNDYMLYLHATGVPLLSNLATKMGKTLMPVFTLIVIGLYWLIIYLLTLSYTKFRRKQS